MFAHTALSSLQRAQLAGILRSYAGAATGMVMTLILNSYLAASRRTRALISVAVSVVAADAALMWFLSRSYGAQGIALSVTIGTCLYCVVLLVLIFPGVPIQIRSTLLARVSLVGAGALAMHFFLVSVVKVHAFGSQPLISSAVIPVLCGMTVYVGWLAFHRKRLQFSRPEA
jgi:hypothetical protein